MYRQAAAIKRGWTCFHCGETFVSAGLAALHFGADETAEAACRIKAGHERNLIATLRAAETELARYRVDDSDTDRAMARLQCEHDRVLRREEEKGYARGLREAGASEAGDG
jgi:hypothetical protein